MQDLYSTNFNKKLHDIQYNNRISVIICNTKYYDTCIILSCHEIKESIEGIIGAHASCVFNALKQSDMIFCETKGLAAS